MISEKHIKNKNNGQVDNDYKKMKRKIYESECCGKEFISASSKSKHKKKCTDVKFIESKFNFNDKTNDYDNINVNNSNNSTNVINAVNAAIGSNNINTTNVINDIARMASTQDNAILMQMLQTMKEQAKIDAQERANMQAQITSLINLSQTNASAVEKSASATEKTADVANKSMNILKYVQINFPDAPALKKLNKKEAYGMLGYDNPKNLEEENEKYVRLVLANYENKNIAKFFGDLIVNYYKEDDVKDVRFWSADVARLCFVVMHTVNKEGKREWLKDKSGKKFTAMVIDPMFEALKVIFDDFLKFKTKWQKKCKNPTVAQMDYVLNARQKCMELKKDLKYDKYTQQILKIVAPSFDFDTYKISIDSKDKEEKNIILSSSSDSDASSLHYSLSSNSSNFNNLSSSEYTSEYSDNESLNSDEYEKPIEKTIKKNKLKIRK